MLEQNILPPTLLNPGAEMPATEMGPPKDAALAFDNVDVKVDPPTLLKPCINKLEDM